MTIFLNTLYNALAFIFVGYPFFRITQCFAESNKNRILQFVAFLGLSFVANTVMFNNDIVNVTYAMIGFLLIMLICYKGKMINRISAVMVLYPIVVACNYLTMSLLIEIYFLFGESPLLEAVIEILRLVMTVALWLTLYQLSKKKIKNIQNYIDTKTWILVDIICLAPLIAIIITIISTVNGRIFYSYPIAVACLITSIGMFFLLNRFVGSIKTTLENENLKLQYSYYKELENNQQEVRKLGHDMNNHLEVVSSLLDQGEVDAAKEYFKNIEGKFTAGNRVFCKNGIVNAVLNSKYNNAVDLGADCFFNVDIDEPVGIDDVDLCVIFGNTLDNALEAISHIAGDYRKIALKTRCDKGYFTYSLENNKENEVDEENGRFISNKVDNKNHGIGVERVKEIVEKYKGTIDISYTDTKFSVLIIISN